VNSIERIVTTAENRIIDMERVRQVVALEREGGLVLERLKPLMGLFGVAGYDALAGAIYSSAEMRLGLKEFIDVAGRLAHLREGKRLVIELWVGDADHQTKLYREICVEMREPVTLADVAAAITEQVGREFTAETQRRGGGTAE
jgi:hypothetical protein